jgi:hypothetical protein
MGIQPIGLVHWLVHKLILKLIGILPTRYVSPSICLDRYRINSGTETTEYIVAECLKCGAKTFFIISIFIMLGSCVNQARTVYNELVGSGCLGASSDGVSAVAAEHADPSQPDWLACMFDGGSVDGCNVPCQ